MVLCKGKFSDVKFKGTITHVKIDVVVNIKKQNQWNDRLITHLRLQWSFNIDRRNQPKL